jgi:hypothetical protein
LGRSDKATSVAETSENRVKQDSYMLSPNKNPKCYRSEREVLVLLK